MYNPVKHMVRKALRSLGYDLVRAENEPRHASPDTWDSATTALFEYVEPYTMTSRERISTLIESVRYVVKHDIPGDVVECGVWKGGSMMAAARVLMSEGVSRRLHLFDTFEGMSEPTDVDRNLRGELAADQLAAERKDTSYIWAYAALDEVRQNLASTGYDLTKVSFVQGKVEESIPSHAPDTIALLRLDTDWYESTYHELTHLYPRLSVGGVLIIDDYGHWQGARRAVDQYISENNLKLLLHRIDYTGRVCVKMQA